ncbi:MAG: peptide chain release factor N(5)-glutamine methyltransferase [Alphaproteobacteria bacterium]|nr:peptide chain release factor N(5)-glutamine methyltransferase [Alphaproteobacteria bacterium]
MVTEAAVTLSAAGFTEPTRHARRLVSSALAISPTDLFAHPDLGVDEQQEGRVQALLRRLAAGEPLSRIFGKRAFWGLEFSLSADTLDPRPETETVVEGVLRRIPDRSTALRLLDLGTGTGCLLLALLSDLPAATGVGVDITEGAVQTAMQNADLLGFSDRARFLVGDWATALSQSFDIIVANPPYIRSDAIALLPPEVACYDPRRALDGGEDGLQSFREVAEAVPARLSSRGILAVEIGAGQAAAATAIISENGLIVDSLEHDLAGIARCVIARPALSGSRRQKKVGMGRRPD